MQLLATTNASHDVSSPSLIDYMDMNRVEEENPSVYPPSRVSPEHQFIGIPTIFHRSDPKTQVSQRSASANEYWFWRERYGQESKQNVSRKSWSWGCAPTKTQAPRNKRAWEEMPIHLLPFSPYVEKSMNERKRTSLIARSTHMSPHTIQQWLSACQLSHGERCQNEQRTLQMRKEVKSLYLIDVKDFCLIPATAEMKYVALSYVWGTSDSDASTTDANLEQHLRLQGLRRGPFCMPRTVTDAMHLVDSLDERYLWVDRFCIIQDHYDTKQNQLTAMGQIYASALFTLVAAQTEDATRSLYGSRNMMLTPSKDAPKAFNKRDGPTITSREILIDQPVHLMRSKWFSRGWTFQEYLFSNRRVVFHNDTVNWECCCSSWHETQNLQIGPEDTESKSSTSLATVQTCSTGFDVSPWPDVHRYVRLVASFNERDLTYPEDVLDAMTGCLGELSKVFPGGFISGLPTMCFDAALLWQPWLPTERRRSKRSSNNNAVLPSWSWTGWAGTLHTESWRSASNYQLMEYEGRTTKEQCSWKTRSTVKWSCSKEVSSQHWPIDLSPQFAHPTFDVEEIKPLTGWSNAGEPHGDEDKLFYHQCDPAQPFRFPFPVCGPQNPPQPIVNARYLHCTTSRTYLKFGEVFPSWCANCPAVDLITPSGRWAGVLRLNCSPSETEIMLTNMSHGSDGLCELVEISVGSVENLEIEERSFDEWKRPGCPLQSGFYEFVNVLWIERVEEVAYRQALGRVEMGVWNELARDRVDLTLG